MTEFLLGIIAMGVWVTAVASVLNYILNRKRHRFSQNAYKAN